MDWTKAGMAVTGIYSAGLIIWLSQQLQMFDDLTTVAAAEIMRHHGDDANAMESRVGRQDDLSSRCINALPEVKKVVAGGIAGCVAKTAVAPLSRVTVLMQVQSMRPHKFADGKNPNNQPLDRKLGSLSQLG
eukprot:symbB.v1.2.000426.t1/scaffold30.1/size407774/42